MHRTPRRGEKYFLSPNQAISLVLSDSVVVQSLLPFSDVSSGLPTCTGSVAKTEKVGARTILVRAAKEMLLMLACFQMA